MTRHSDPALWTAVDQAEAVRGGGLTAVGLLEACLARVERHNEKLNAVVTLNPEAHNEAEVVDRRLSTGDDPGPLAGLVVGIKDVTETAGLRTTYGSPLYADHIPDEDALVVRRLREAGAVILGKTNTPEFAAGGNTWNDVFGATRNPWATALSAGGSTGGGAAALATGMISLAQGTDLGGSLRIPASFCGVVGLRPTPGLIPTLPSAYLWDDLQVTGLMARTAGDIALGLRAVAGSAAECPVVAPDPVWADQGRPTPSRVAYVRDIAGIGIEPDVGRVCDEAAGALAEAGISVTEIDLDLSGGVEAFLALRGHWFVSHFFDELHRIDAFGPNVSANLKSGLEVTTRGLGEAENGRRRVREELLGVCNRFDALITPCMAIPPFPVDENFPATIAGKAMKTYIDWVAPTFLLSLAGLPVASAPAGLDGGGLPVGLQLVGPAGGEPQVLALAEELQRLRPLSPPRAD